MGGPDAANGYQPERASVARQSDGVSVVRLKRVTFRHGEGKVVLRDVSLRVDRGDRVALLGGNGSGKTTLLQLVGGQLEPETGTVDRDDGLRIAYFSQHTDIADDATPV